MPTVVLTDPRFYSKGMEDRFREAGLRLEVKPFQTEKELLENVREADGILITSAPFRKNVIDGLKRCRVIVRFGIGVDKIDLAAATEKKIWVANTPGLYADEVSNHVITLLMVLSRKMLLTHQLVKRGTFQFHSIQPIYSLNGKTLGLIGLGRIGRAILKKLKVFNINCLAYDPYLPRNAATEYEVEAVSLERLLSDSDFISVNCPLTEETKGLLGEDQFRIMKKTAFIINTARGGIIDESALLKALRNHWIAGAGLDVFTEEPPRKNHPLFKLKNVIATPHIGWYSEESMERMRQEGFEEICRVFRGEVPKNLVNRELEHIIS